MFNGSIDLSWVWEGGCNYYLARKISLFFSCKDFHLILYFEFYLSFHYSMYETTVYSCMCIHAKFMVNFIIDVP